MLKKAIMCSLYGAECDQAIIGRRKGLEEEWEEDIGEEESEVWEDDWEEEDW